MRDEDTGIVPIVESGHSRKLVGVVTDRDLCLGLIAGQTAGDPSIVPVEECMTTKVINCKPDDDIETALELMRENQVRRILVVDEQNTVQGIVSMADLVRRADLPAGETRETLESISEPTGEASRPRAESAEAGN
jgi:CBS domain-containing protein